MILAQPTNRLENDSIVKLIGGRHHVWLGINDIAQEGVWKYAADGGRTNLGAFKFWWPGEPNNAGGHEDCAELYGEHQGRWNDLSCSWARRFVCQSSRVFFLAI